MALAISRNPVLAADTRFYVIMAAVMALLNICGFSLFAVMGVSSFHAPIYVHVHAILFMGWVMLFMTQVSLAGTGSLALHRKLGWVAVGWALAMVVVGTLTTLWSVQKAAVPFFFLPAQFLLMNPLSVLLFAALLIGGVVKRRDREWHPRLILCGMAAIMGPSFGRLVPAPIFLYSTLTAVFVGMIAFPVVGIIRDRLRYGRVHPAWWLGLGSLLLLQLASETLGRSPVAAAIYDRAAIGTPGASVPALTYQRPPFPTGS
ncbi:hypothetical protein SAMIE_1034680 [Sphingobium amiense]|uniref:Uncharacterized protein n=1 Tax=Sphingobium amiense TaxID=135719 RepID=A0A494WB95_9SPHN|nr:hypothetical protein [Sphingobium amiense]BBD99967.1 hypothetical protein SAMIE_1034680 [Sphingobium amiense]